MRSLLALSGSVAVLSGLCAGCAPQTVASTPQVYYPEDAYQEYIQRSDKITLSAGNDHDVNTRVQSVDPWPPYVGDRRVYTSGERMAGAVERARDVSQIGKTPKPLPIQETTSSGGVSTGGGGQ